MTRISLINPHETSADRSALLQQIHGAFGAVPNMFRAVANSPAALASMWGSFGALGNGVLPAALSEQIAVAVAEANRCDYCLAAHTLLGKNAGVSAEAMAKAQLGLSDDPKTAAALQFAVKLVRQRAAVSDTDIKAIRDAGYSEQEVVEILAHVALNIFTNYVNVAFNTPLDFPAVAFRS